MSTKIVSTNNGTDFSTVLPSILVDTDGNYLDISPSGSSYGDVDGPAGATANAVALFNGTSGKIIKNSNITWNGSTLGVAAGMQLATNSGTMIAQTMSGNAVLYTDNGRAVVNAKVGTAEVLADTGGVIVTAGGGDVDITSSTADVNIQGQTGIDVITVSGQAVFGSDNYSTTVRAFEDIHLNAGYVGPSGDIILTAPTGDIKANANIIPYASGTRNIGTQAMPFNEAWIQNIHGSTLGGFSPITVVEDLVMSGTTKIATSVIEGTSSLDLRTSATGNFAVTMYGTSGVNIYGVNGDIKIGAIAPNTTPNVTISADNNVNVNAGNGIDILVQNNTYLSGNTMIVDMDDYAYIRAFDDIIITADNDLSGSGDFQAYGAGVLVNANQGTAELLSLGGQSKVTANNNLVVVAGYSGVNINSSNGPIALSGTALTFNGAAVGWAGGAITSSVTPTTSGTLTVGTAALPFSGVVSNTYLTTRYTNTAASGITIDWNNGAVQYVDYTGWTGTSTITLSNGNAGSSYLLETKNNASGTAVMAWAANTILWRGGIAGIATVASGSIDAYSFIYNGSKYLGSFGSDYK